MRGHKIIESLLSDIDAFRKDLRPDGGVADAMEKVVLEIKNSIHFSFSAPFSIPDMKKLISTEYYSETLPLFKHLPYDSMLVEYDVVAATAIDNDCHNVSDPYDARMAVLVKKIGNETHIHTFVYFKEVKRWVSNAFNCVIEYGEDKVSIVFRQIWDIRKTMEVDQDVIYHLQLQSLQGLSTVGKMLQLLKCKNIVDDIIGPPKKLQKKRIKNGKQPLFSYHVLKIKAHRCSEKEEYGDKGLYYDRIHLCRGHFKTYTAEKPLFGRITGTYWWQPSVRGNKDKGIIQKDYLVEA